MSMIKAKVKSTGEIVNVRPERDGFFVDDENNNSYKFEELDFVDETEVDEETRRMESMKNIFPSLFQMPDFNKNEMEKFWAEKHIDVIFRLLLFDQFKDINDMQAFATALSYARTIIQEVRGQQNAVPTNAN